MINQKRQRSESGRREQMSVWPAVDCVEPVEINQVIRREERWEEKKLRGGQGRVSSGN